MPAPPSSAPTPGHNTPLNIGTPAMGSRGSSPPPPPPGGYDVPRINVLTAEDAVREGDQPLKMSEKTHVNPSD